MVQEITELGSEMSGDDGSDSEYDADRDVLLQEYHRAVGVLDRQFEHILRVAGIGFSAAGALLFLITSNNLKIGEWAFWAAPLALTLLYTVIIYLLYQITFATYYVRELEDNVAEKFGIEYFHFQTASAKGLSNFRTGLPQMRAVFVLLLLFVAGVYAGVVAACLVGLHAKHAPVWREVSFVALQVILGGTLLWSATGTTKSLKDRYAKWSKLNREKATEESERMVSAASIRSLVGYALLPRKQDFIIKPILTLGSALVTVLFLGVSISGEILASVLLVTVCLEFLAKQATYIWNDLLDMDSDRDHPRKKNTRILLKANARAFGKVLFLIRSAIAFTMAGVLAHSLHLWWLPVLIFLVFVWHYIYERWAKVGVHPYRRLIMVSLGYWERAMAGSLAVMTVEGHYDALIVAGITFWIALMQCGAMANLWMNENRYLAETKSDGIEGGGGRTLPEFGKHGEQMQTWSSVALILTGGLLAVLYVPSLGKGRATPHWNGAVANWLESRASSIAALVHDLKSSNHIEEWSREGRLIALCIALGISIAVLWIMRHELTHAPKPIKLQLRWKWIGPLLALTAFSCLMLSLESSFMALAFLVPLLLTAASAGITYDELNQLEEWLSRGSELVPWIDGVIFGPWSLKDQDENRIGQGADENIHKLMPEKATNQVVSDQH